MFFQIKKLMFSSKLYLSISLSIESLSAIRPQQEEETECTERKREAQTIRQQGKWSKSTA